MGRYGWRAARAMAAVAMVMVVVACGSTRDSGRSPGLPATGTATVEVGGRPVTVHVPSSYGRGHPAPLVVALHGYTSSAQELESYLRLTPESDRRGFVYVYPDGSVDAQDKRFWNATDACCSFFSPKPDDSRYLSDLITRIEGTYRIDRTRVYLIGHSNGAFMAFRMACDHADQVTAIVALNGATWGDAARCRPSEPVGVLAVHSRADETVAFGGGQINGVAYPSAAVTIARWVAYDHCAPPGRDAPALDLVANLPGAETSVRTYTSGCAAGTTVRAWTINGGSHAPDLGPAFPSAVTDFLFSQVKPAR